MTTRLPVVPLLLAMILLSSATARAQPHNDPEARRNGVRMSSLSLKGPDFSRIRTERRQDGIILLHFDGQFRTAVVAHEANKELHMDCHDAAEDADEQSSSGNSHDDHE
jgi:hypothetical protein